MSKKLLSIFVGTIAVVLAIGSLFVSNRHAGITRAQIQQVPQTSVSKQEAILTYNGEQGIDALTLLKKHAQIDMSSSGLITSINGRKADDSQREYWAFYVNSKMSTVGPAQYQTKSTDVILWRIVKY
ncbi:MAG: DUF4430 domain-containing protein [Patescibacteria group bacterium]|nr:DUF4430 domain-containing protein [Patescibacteria group bacterium]